MRFFHQPWQKQFFQDQLNRHGRSRQALGKVFSRIPIKKTHRSVDYADGARIVGIDLVGGEKPAAALFGPIVV